MRKGNIGIFIVFLGCLAASVASAAGNPAGNPDPATLARHIYLGQAYPSGNVYLVPFPFPGPSQSEDDYRKSFPWPKSITYRSLAATAPVADRTKPGHLSGVLHDTLRGNVIETSYIPAREAMDDQHESCDERPRTPKNSRYVYAGDDFFGQVSDNCNSAGGTSVYKGEETGVISYAVVAFDAEAPLSGFKAWKGRPRPLTPEEAAAVAKEKRDFEKDAADCETNPMFLDAATILMTADVTGTDTSIRLSQYQSAGCGGHLATYYILDILRAGALVGKYELVQYIGPI